MNRFRTIATQTILVIAAWIVVPAILGAFLNSAATLVFAVVGAIIGVLFALIWWPIGASLRRK